jgi:hypothetical protein
MAKEKFTEEDDALLAELGVEVEAKNVSARTPREERIIAGFEEIERFVEQNGRLPLHGEDRDIFERLYAIRLDNIRGSAECRVALEGLDSKGLLTAEPVLIKNIPEDMDDEALLAELGVDTGDKDDITHLTYVKRRSERMAAEEVAQRKPCKDFKQFEPLFLKVQEELKIGIRVTGRFKENAVIQQGEFFILGGQIVYVAEVGEDIRAPNGESDARMRVIYNNGTESNLLRRSLQRALYKDEAGRRVSDNHLGPLFGSEAGEDDIESGTIYVLRSLSENPVIKEHQELLHKIGVTGSDIERRIANARNDATYMLAEVEIVATYKLSNINRVKLENLLHRFFDPARLTIEIKDRFGKPVLPREWFLVPLRVIDEVVQLIREGRLGDYRYDREQARIVEK